MAQAPEYVRGESFIEYATDHPDAPFPPANLEAELNDVKVTTDALSENAAKIQRDDGALKNQIVTTDSLSPQVAALFPSGTFVPRGLWQTATAYAARDIVEQGGGTYVCVTAHMSGVFATDKAAGKWMALSYIVSAFVLSMFDDADGLAVLATLGVSAYMRGMLQDADSPTTALTLLGFSAFIETLINDANGPAACATLGAVSHTIVDLKGDLLLGGAPDTVVRVGSPGDGNTIIAQAAQTGGWTFTPNRIRSLAPNPLFMVNQRQGSAVADDAYCADRWYVLTQSNPITYSIQTDQEDGQPFNIRLTQSNATPQRMGLACIIEGKDIKYMRNRVSVLAARLRVSSGQAIRYAVLEWTGTLDTVTSDVVNDWTSGAYTAGNFFLGANLTVTNVGAKTPAAGAWADTDSLLAGLGATLNNVILVVWTEAVAAQNVTLDIGAVRYVEGIYMPAHTGIIVPNYAEELMRSKRFFKRIPPTTETISKVASGFNSTTVIAHCVLPLEVEMRGKPALTFGTVGSYFLQHGITNTACTALSMISDSSPLTLGLLATVAAGLTAGQGCNLSLTTFGIDISADL